MGLFDKAEPTTIVTASGGGRPARDVSEDAKTFYATLTKDRKPGDDKWIGQAYKVTLTEKDFGPAVSDLRLLAGRDENATTLNVRFATVNVDGKDVPAFEKGKISVTFQARVKINRPRKNTAQAAA